LYARRALGLAPAPEFHVWLRDMGIFAGDGEVALGRSLPAPFQRALSRIT
jgi:ethanolamine ammonia-lyase large subunit